MKIPQTHWAVLYIIGGGMAALLDLFFLRLFTSVVGILYLRSAVGSFVIAMSFAFIFQKYVTFKEARGHRAKQAGGYFVFQLIGQGLYMVLLKVGVEWLWLRYLLAACGAKVIVLGRNLVTNKLIVFRPLVENQ